MTKTLAAMLDDRNNKANYNSFVNGHPTWRRSRQLQTKNMYYLAVYVSAHKGVLKDLFVWYYKP